MSLSTIQSRRLMLKVVTFVAMVLFCAITWIYVVLFRRFSCYLGDGSMVDMGFWSYPRYRISFSESAIDNSYDRSFQIVDLPNVKWTFGLIIKPTVSLRKNISVSVVVLDSSERIVCDLSDTLDAWEFSYSINESFYYHPRFREIAFGKSGPFTMHLVITDSGDSRYGQVVTPFCQGGGSELP